MGIFARDVFSKYKKRVHDVSRAEMPALPGTDFVLSSSNREGQVWLVVEEHSDAF
jgi:hypothetical protein